MIFGRVARVLSLPRPERRLLAEAFVLLGAVAPLLRYGPGSLTGRLLKRASAPVPGDADARVVAEIARAVSRAAPYVPGATCLAQALAGWVMMRRRNERGIVRLGVNRTVATGLLAHAWLECNGERVIGGQNAADFTPFPPVS